MRFKNQVRGIKAKRQGEAFETYLKIAANNQKVSYLKIPQGCELRKYMGQTRPVLVKSPFDFIMAYKGTCLFFDCKSTIDQTFFRSKIDWDQVESLKTLYANGCKAGLIVFFGADNRLTAEAHFYPLNQILTLAKGDSLKPSLETFIGKIYPTLSVDLIGLFNKL